jgi:hypothetical protein
MVDRKVVPFDEFYYQLKLTHVFQKHPVFTISLFLSFLFIILVFKLLDFFFHFTLVIPVLFLLINL